MIRFRSGLSKLFAGCMILALLSFLLQSGTAAAIGIMGLLFFACSKWEIPRFTLVVFVLGIVLRVACLAFVNPPPVSDFAMMLDAAQGLLARGGPLPDTVYFRLWAYQSVFVVYESFLLRICNSVLFLQIVNAIEASLIVALLYRMLLPHVSKRAAQFSALLLTVFPLSLLLHTLLSNQIPSALFFVLGLWVLTSPDCKRLRFWRFPLAGLCIQLGNLFRAEGILILVAVLAYVVFWLLGSKKHDKTARRSFALGIAALLAVYVAVGACANFAVRQSGVNPYGTANGLPEWKFVLGFNAETGGKYSDKDWSMIYPTLDENHQRTAETEQVIAGMMQARMPQSVSELLDLLRQKNDHMWNKSPMHWFFEYHWAYDSARFQFMEAFNQCMVYAVSILAVYGLLRRRDALRGGDAAAYLPLFVMFASYCAFLLVEVQPRYGYLPLIFLFCGAAYGTDCLIGGKKNGRE